ncbi:hypothetical protein LTR36_004178 [Oleoguttula mirabilis]|uniref:Atos-like conserved domain-containing protein n=1 Tax=Oleoguttula mirabilis TaxID=1507867 RepID=A0AAV9JIC2_9PEZI|nr:hypothetical protein LTR36_004178 [Oleoguttula mirabilis]
MAIYNGSPAWPSTYDADLSSSTGDQDGQGGRRPGSSGQSSQISPSAIVNPYYTGRPRTPANGSTHTSIDRQEIMRKIKIRDSRPASPELERIASAEDLLRRIRSRESRPSSPALERPPSVSSKRLRPPTPLSSSGLLTEQRPPSPYKQDDNQSIGLQIERPRSSLHRGDFREKRDTITPFACFGDATRHQPPPSLLSMSPVAPWHPDFAAAVFRQARPQRQRPPSPPGLHIQSTARSRAVSHASLATSFVYKPPTSPLAQSSRPDTPEPGPRQKSRSPDRSRRHTFSPQSQQDFQSALRYPASARDHDGQQPALVRFDRTFPYQAHQPRRSLNSFQAFPQPSLPRVRRPSVSESPLHHAPMVGSYEESILRGRMSTTPSKPLNFVAQIGVLGRGECKSSLRCPPHVTVPFPAVFYSYGSAVRATDQPSPYVGLVDLENSLPSADPLPEKRRSRIPAALTDEGSRASSRTREDSSIPDTHITRRRRQKQKRRSGSPKAPPGGSYRIPQQGQLQIILKNPNKTAVKLFLVPYDLSDMEPGQKTFIRQRSYSAGPIIDMPLSSRKNLGTDRPEAALNTSDDPNERPMLRYLVHLHMCCPSKGRYFLYKSVRVVFANRVPDGKEKLCNEIQLPEPRYSAYKPGRDSNVAAASTNTPNESARTRDDLEPPSPAANVTPWPQSRRFMAQSLPASDYGPSYGLPSQPLPCDITTLSPLKSRPASRETSDGMDVDSDRSPGTQSSRSALPSPTSRNHESVQLWNVRRLEDPFNFERDHSRERQPDACIESLLSRRLKDWAFGQRERDDLNT